MKRKSFAISTTILTGLLACIVLLTPKVKAAELKTHNYAEALQKSIYFYETEKCGTGISGGPLEWRGDCHVTDCKLNLRTETNLPGALVTQYQDLFDPDGDGCVDLHGGYHDAGDHVKFGLPQGYAASTLGWGFYEFRQAFKETKQEAHMLNTLKWFTDYFLRSTFINQNGEVVAFAYMVGQGTVDHNYWGPPELQLSSKYKRTAEFATASNPAGDQVAEAAASLALMSLNYQDIDPAYAQKCLKYSKALYEFARKYRGLGNSDGFYGSRDNEDDLSWAAVWLYVATKNMDYINHITSTTATGLYDGYMKKIISTTENTWQNIWVHCWDSVWGGTFVELAKLFPAKEFPDNKMYKQFDYFARWNLEYWSGGKIPHEDPRDISIIKPSAAGYAMLNTWGSARYNCAAQLCALVYQKNYPERMQFANWAKSQIDYLLGNNPMGYSYVVGYGEKSAMHPHHRAAHGSTTNSTLNPSTHRHMLWGALVGGPDGNDVHKDDTSDYAYNEVAIDYNAGLVGAVAGHYLLYGQGQKALENFPPKEAAIEEFFMEARLEQESKERTQITITMHNDSIHAPRFETGMSCRYFFNIKEMLDAGQTIADLKLEIFYDENKTCFGGPAKISAPIAWDDKGTYYIEFDWSGYNIYGKRELQFAMTAKQDANWKSHWDPTNDWSRQGIEKGNKVIQYIPFYLNGKKIFGQEPAK